MTPSRSSSRRATRTRCLSVRRHHIMVVVCGMAAANPTTLHAQRREPDNYRDRHRHDGHLLLLELSHTEPTTVP
jgi:hypothetical protein